ncbi:unnamed protein product [Paramecium primaurelia]|uniref:Uncharacterized protein n=1 Tax=Paramecium primaurelia TaxID=5886 RepID=A0A8S1JWZ9_PARPR|nr:unnamed protein product [Paramecium primaurelia]
MGACNSKKKEKNISQLNQSKGTQDQERQQPQNSSYNQQQNIEQQNYNPPNQLQQLNSSNYNQQLEEGDLDLLKDDIYVQNINKSFNDIYQLFNKMTSEFDQLSQFLLSGAQQEVQI